MTKIEFAAKVKEMWLKVDQSDMRLEMLLQITEISEDHTITDFHVESSSCIVCQAELLQELVENQDLQHCEGHDEGFDSTKPEHIH